MISPAEHEATLCQLEQNPPEIRLYSDNIREERWAHFSLEGVRFPTATVDVIQRGEALAIFERDLIVRFQQNLLGCCSICACTPRWDRDKESGGIRRALDLTTCRALP